MQHRLRCVALCFPDTFHLAAAGAASRAPSTITFGERTSLPNRVAAMRVIKCEISTTPAIIILFAGRQTELINLSPSYHTSATKPQISTLSTPPQRTVRIHSTSGMTARWGHEVIAAQIPQSTREAIAVAISPQIWFVRAWAELL